MSRIAAHTERFIMFIYYNFLKAANINSEAKLNVLFMFHFPSNKTLK